MSGAPFLTLSELYDVPVGFVTPPSFEVLLYLRSQKGGCCSILDYLSCSYYNLEFLCNEK